MMNRSRLKYWVTSHLKQSGISRVDVGKYVEIAGNICDTFEVNHPRNLPDNLPILASEIATCELSRQQYQHIAILLLDIKHKRPTQRFEALRVTCSCGHKAKYSYHYFRYECSCRKKVNAHHGDHWPLGELAASEISLCRKHAHELFEEMWVKPCGGRNEAYVELERATGLTVDDLHFGKTINNLTDANAVFCALEVLSPGFADAA